MGKRTGINIVLMTFGLLLIVAALILTGYNIWDEERASIESNKVLGQMIDDEKTSDGATADYLLNPAMDMPTVMIDGHDYIGVLNIPILDLSLPIMSDWSYPKLKIAPNRFKGSAYTDNLILAGHNYRTHFGGIKSLSLGDELIFTDVDNNIFTYAVSEIEVLNERDVDLMEAGNWDLTLFTCTLGRVDRITVRCERKI